MFLLLFACSAVLGSKDEVPARLELKLPEGPIYDQEPFDLEPVVLNPFNQPLKVTPALTLSVPAPLEQVGPSSLVCRGAGPAAVRVSVERVERVVHIHCRPLGEIQGPGALRLSVGQQEAVRLTAIDLQGKPMPEVIPKLESQNPAIAQVIPDLPSKVFAISPGSTNLIARVGNRQLPIPVEVLAPSPGANAEFYFTLTEGSSQSWVLGPGSWNVGVRVDSGAAVVAQGGGCGGPHPQSSHHLSCAQSLRLSNPGGAASRGTVVLVRQ